MNLNINLTQQQLATIAKRLNISEEELKKQAKPEENPEEKTVVAPDSIGVNDPEASLQALDSLALMNAMLVNNKAKEDADSKTYTFTSSSKTQTILVNGQNVKVTTTIASKTSSIKLVVDKEGKINIYNNGGSSISFANATQNLNINVQESNSILQVKGGSKNDFITVQKGAKIYSISGNGGDDIIVNSGVDNKSGSINGDAGNDMIFNNSLLSYAAGSNGNDNIFNFGTVNNLTGAAGNDTIMNFGTVTNNIDGGAGTKDIVGGNGTAKNITNTEDIADNFTGTFKGVEYVDGKIDDGYDKDGYDKNGFDRDGYDRQGYNAEGYNRQGFNRQGYDRNGYNAQGYDVNGYNKDGYDKDGYDKRGYNEEGFDKQGFDVNGYDKNGYDKDGYDKNGVDAQGYSKNSIKPFSNSKNEAACKLLGLDTDKDFTKAKYNTSGNLTSFSIGKTNYTVTYASGRISNINAVSGKDRTLTTCAYYSNGNLKTKNVYSYSNNKETGRIQTNITQNGRVSSEEVYTAENGKETAKVVTTFKLDGSQVIDKFVKVGTQYKKTESTEKTFNADGSLKSETTNNYNDNSVLVKTVITEYNADGTKSVRNIDRDSLIFNFEVITVYNDNDKPVSETSITYGTINGIAGQITAKTEKTFDNNNNVASETVYSFENGKQTEYTTTINNDNGTQTVETYETDANGVSTLKNTTLPLVRKYASAAEFSDAALTFINGTEKNLQTAQELVINEMKPIQTATLTEGEQTVNDFRKECEDAINAFRSDFEKNNPGKNFFEYYGIIMPDVNRSLRTEVHINSGSNEFDAIFIDGELQSIYNGKIYNHTYFNGLGGNHTTGFFEFYYEYNTDNTTNVYSTYSESRRKLDANGNMGDLVSTLYVNINYNSKEVNKYEASNKGGGTSIQCHLTNKGELPATDKCTVTVSKNNDDHEPQTTGYEKTEKKGPTDKEMNIGEYYKCETWKNNEHIEYTKDAVKGKGYNRYYYSNNYNRYDKNNVNNNEETKVINTTETIDLLTNNIIYNDYTEFIDKNNLKKYHLSTTVYFEDSNISRAQLIERKYVIGYTTDSKNNATNEQTSYISENHGIEARPQISDSCQNNNETFEIVTDKKGQIIGTKPVENKK